ncbi:UDP-glucose 4-epimerase GalE [Cognatishimia sp. MH4019]|uniref:UDP-glucose 4-epimerase GalE n=1 Tax=Cognatishimia sp. MH4019 TaxID=2854030 RepID=UPI001CD24DDF|nr:UDP-glucose 4-epimerase GalE [Cognatishimia sp. MH4019]
MTHAKQILLVGGAGYIGSHVALALAAAGYSITILDDFSNSSPSTIDRIKRITNRSFDVVEADMRDQTRLDEAFRKTRFDTVILLAGLKSVPDSVEDPVGYYDVNVGGAISILATMQRHGCNSLVFSSSATVYGEPQYLPVDENHPVQPTNPYGSSKLVIEGLIQEHTKANPRFHGMILRYFNPVGAHSSGLIGEQPMGIPGNLFPRLAQAYWSNGVATVFGTDFDTPDGTGMRDYIHVEDLAKGHVMACRHVSQANATQVTCLNLGTGEAFSVRQVIDAWNAVVGKPVSVIEQARRAGDVASCWADPSRAEAVLGWRAERSLQEMCSSHWASFLSLKRDEGSSINAVGSSSGEEHT